MIPGTMSEYQSREAMEVRQLVGAFAQWLDAGGALVQANTSEWEVLRYRALGLADPSGKVTSHVVYRRRDGTINWTGDSRTHWAWFRSGVKLPEQPEIKIPKKGKSWTQRTREKLIERDGMNCYFCGKNMEYDHEGRARPDGKPDITIEHLLSRHNARTGAETHADVEHLDYLVLAHAKCNRDIGHRPMDEKLTYREIMHDKKTTMWKEDE